VKIQFAHQRLGKYPEEHCNKMKSSEISTFQNCKIKMQQNNMFHSNSQLSWQYAYSCGLLQQCCNVVNDTKRSTMLVCLLCCHSSYNTQSASESELRLLAFMFNVIQHVTQCMIHVTVFNHLAHL